MPGSLGDIEYKRGLLLDAFAPKGEPRPAALLIHGGRGNRRGYITRLYEQATRAGYAWFAPDYAGAADLIDAVRYVRCPGRFPVNRKLVLIAEHQGASAAIHLASDPRVRADGVVIIGGRFPPDAAAPSTSAPVLMIHGERDEQWPAAQAEAWCKSLPTCRFYLQLGSPKAPDCFQR